MTSKFHHPYNFIPVTAEINGKDSGQTDYKDIATGETQARHDCWRENHFSGRIICRLHLVTPVVVGATQEKGKGANQPSKVPPYKYKNRYVVPANSLRGMIGSIVEALSQSALRVLDDAELEVSVYDPKTNKCTSSPKGRVYDYFRNISADTIPWDKDRYRLTPAEMLLGAVEDPRREKGPARNLASRVRFSDGRLASGSGKTRAPVTLKILASPKPPSPSMYFKPEMKKQGTYISKARLNSNHIPKGRKIYLHHPQDAVNSGCWETKNSQRNNQKLSCTPLESRRKQDFYFHIDFDNLTSAELTLMLKSLDPGAGFCHRLGLGKPLGLGSVSVHIEGVFFIDRLKRYGANALDEARYHEVLRNDVVPNPIDWQSLYQEEAACLSEMRANLIAPSYVPDESLIDQETLKILRAVGNVTNLKDEAPVQYPKKDTQDGETKGYEWYVTNEKAGNPQALKSIQAGQELPTLKTYK